MSILRTMPFLPTTKAELQARALAQPDFIFVSGDAYVDHPSFGAAIMTRLLESKGYSVAVLARPDPSDVETFRCLGKPRLAFLITSGAIDSMVMNYTANRRLRSDDDYAPGGDPCLCRGPDGSIHPYMQNGAQARARPDRALIAYCGKCREAFKGVTIIAGGLEASLRRLSHYDYVSDTVRKPIILDAKADLVIYGMGERQILEAAKRLSAQPDHPKPSQLLRGIAGTVWRTGKADDVPQGTQFLPPHEEAAADKASFARSFAMQYRATDPGAAVMLAEQAAGQFVVQEAPEKAISQAEMDEVYALPFMRLAHPAYKAYGGVPALSEVKFSITSSRGCYGACAFCALAFHQGRVVSGRSRQSIVAEGTALAQDAAFKGYIHDVGGPTANFRGPACERQDKGSCCVDRRCLAPSPCPSLRVDHREYLGILRALRAIPGVAKVFIRSGLRFDYIMADKDDSFLRELAEHHVSGQLKVAPEHVSERVLSIMGKAPHRVYDAFARRWADINNKLSLKQYLVPYFIASHPGATLDDAIELACYLRDAGFVPDQVQDFYPTPGTLATAMYHSGLDPLTMNEVYVAKGARERSMQRALLQYNKPENRALVIEALRTAGRTDLIGSGPECLAR